MGLCFYPRNPFILNSTSLCIGLNLNSVNLTWLKGLVNRICLLRRLQTVDLLLVIRDYLAIKTGTRINDNPKDKTAECKSIKLTDLCWLMKSPKYWLTGLGIDKSYNWPTLLRCLLVIVRSLQTYRSVLRNCDRFGPKAFLPVRETYLDSIAQQYRRFNYSLGNNFVWLIVAE